MQKNLAETTEYIRMNIYINMVVGLSVLNRLGDSLADNHENWYTNVEGAQPDLSVLNVFTGLFEKS